MKNICSCILYQLYTHWEKPFAIAHCMKSVQIRSFFWSVISGSRTEYGEILRISPYSVRLLENTGQKKFRIWTLFTQWLLLKVCESFLSRHNIKPVVCFSLCQASLGFQRSENKMNTVYEKWNYFSICRYLVWCA